MEKVMITVATTGAFPTKGQNPNIPLTPEEIADDVYECWKAGASIAHVHVRDDEGKGTMNLEKFKETVQLIRSRCDIVLNLTTSGDLNATDDDRIAHLIELKPEMATFDAGTMNWMHDTLFINHPHFLEKLGRITMEHAIKPEIEIMDAGMVYNSFHYVNKGVLNTPGHYQFVMGVPGGIGATIENLVFLKGLIPQDATWSAFGVGRHHLPILFATIAMGGHVRVGMEDNVFYTKNRLAKSNAEFVERAARLIREAGKEVASPDEARQILKLHNHGERSMLS
ncbi:3-keto-5-aminohexanoate cleavage protein [Paenibacillus eucommiae]|uniref:Uncharacterized protein (DUF849 family) n=1 Tax=Paenibacillus eucommiae TaxID=1355755 RepID=A0ABS4IWJ9_9BACL|nr:3-keto-5-aminohexanoate cleavage protein [Paenibacillus eucommiae]MBP1991959.1 uncharacterized protein (DUF849 family) [Paenibacillus eucommiae]